MDALKVLAVADPAVMSYVDLKLIDQYPDEVKMDVFPWADYYSTMLEVFEGKADYDVIMVAGHLWKRDFVEKGYLAPLSYEEEDILPVIAREMKYEGIQYLSPSFCDGHIIVYRKSILKAVLGKEFGDTVAPQEYAEAAQRLHQAGYRIAMKADESEIFTDALPFLRMGGTDVYDEKTGLIQCDREEVILGLKKYTELKSAAFSDTETYGNEAVAEKIRSKEAVMAVTWSGQMGTVINETCIDKDDLGYATFSTAWNVTWSFAVSSGTPRKKEAEELLRFLRSAEIDGRAGSVSGAPVRRGNYLPLMEKYPWYRCQLAMFDNAKLLPDLANAGEKNGVLYHQIALTFSGAKTSEEAMRDAMKQIKELES